MTHQQQPQQPSTARARETVTFRDGPMDGYQLDVTGWSEEQRATGVAHICPQSTYGDLGGRALYGPPGGDPSATVWHWEGDTA